MYKDHRHQFTFKFNTLINNIHHDFINITEIIELYDLSNSHYTQRHETMRTQKHIFIVRGRRQTNGVQQIVSGVRTITSTVATPAPTVTTNTVTTVTKLCSTADNNVIFDDCLIL
jgi:hypothetical protein